MSPFISVASEIARFDPLQRATRRHRQRHGCNAYTFEDGAGLLAIARFARAHRILEVGTAIGYTACVLATATKQTRVDTIESDPEHVVLAREQICELGLEDRITVWSGDCFDVMSELAGPYDLAFFDGLAPTVEMIHQLRDLLRPNGLLVCGNIVHAGSVERMLIAAELETAERWQFISSIEGGGTFVFRKIDPGAPRPSAPLTKG